LPSLLEPGSDPPFFWICLSRRVRLTTFNHLLFWSLVPSADVWSLFSPFVPFSCSPGKARCTCPFLIALPCCVPPPLNWCFYILLCFDRLDNFYLPPPSSCLFVYVIHIPLSPYDLLWGMLLSRQQLPSALAQPSFHPFHWYWVDIVPRYEVNLTLSRS